jgi:hypothetical protein
MLKTQVVAMVKRGLLAAAGGGALQACWALYANWEYGAAIRNSAAAAQGASSFTMSFIITVIMDALLALFAWIESRVIRLAVVLLLSFAIMSAIHASVQWMNGTPRILLTIAPAVIIGTVYCTVYLLARLELWRRRAPAASTVADGHIAG